MLRKSAVKTFFEDKKLLKENVGTWTKLVMVVCRWRQRPWCHGFMTTVTSLVWYRCAVNPPSVKNAVKLKTRENTFVKAPPSASVSLFEVSFGDYTDIRRFYLSVHRWSRNILHWILKFCYIKAVDRGKSRKHTKFAHITIFRLHLVIIINWFSRAKYLFMMKAKATCLTGRH